MNQKKLIISSFLQSLGVMVYVAGVVLIITNGEKIFGKMNNFFGPMTFLLLFVLSATITGALMLGRPVILYLENKKIEAIKLFSYSVGWLFLFTVIMLVAQVLIKLK